jgi:uncharacterized 2Fe-2S/4Fe-4S cluster protein (DUF4445 family)
MADTVRITLQPAGETLAVPRGSPLQDLLFARGVEFPCGGRGSCQRCRVRVLRGAAPVTAEEEAALTAAEIAQGWRLACRLRPEEDITIEVAQWETVILSDNTALEFVPREGLGVAVDLGTTTLVAQLVDLASGRVLGVRTALNPQAAYGADVMSRVECAVFGRDGGKLTEIIRAAIGELVTDLVALAGPEADTLREVVVVGNTVMHHLFCGIDVEPLSYVPFHSTSDGLQVFRPADLGWIIPGEATVRFLPCLGGFVGSDILAGVLATRMHESGFLAGLIDLGTNGEIVFGNRQRMVCASTAAGPAFEGGRISMGMRAATGAIAEVREASGVLSCRVLGNTRPRGICGSGLVDAVAAGLELGLIAPSGRLTGADAPWVLVPPVSITQSDVRQLQLAKAAIAAGIRILLGRLNATPADVTRLYLAGAFGNYVNRSSARRIGLFDFPEELVTPAGNTALLGAKLSLFEGGRLADARRKVEHVSLAADAEFQQTYVEEIAFPSTAS